MLFRSHTLYLDCCFLRSFIFSSVFQCRFYRCGNFIRKIHRNCVSNHFVRVIGSCINEVECIWKALYSCYFSYSHPAIQTFFSFDKLAFVLSYKSHLRGLRVQLALSARRLHCKSLFVPRFNSVSAHKNRRVRASKIFVVVDGGGIMILRKRDSRLTCMHGSVPTA